MEVNKHSGFWMGNDVQDRYYNPLTGQTEAPSGKDIFAMIGYQKAIANFVRIVTGDNIPVKWNGGNDSYTDGKTVVLSGNIKSGNFDVAVGLALHEGSHIKLTDFTTLQNGLGNYISTALFEKGEKKGLTKGTLTKTLKDLLNVVEDRRIDKYIQTEAPGYRGYYEALYDHYFNDKMIDIALQKGIWCDATVDHYMAHIVNFINANRNLDQLPGLRAIWKILNLRDIARLKSTDDALQTALEILDELLNHLPDYVAPAPEPEQKEEEKAEDEENEEGDDTGKAESANDKIKNRIEELKRAAQAKNITADELITIGDYLKKFKGLLTK